MRARILGRGSVAGRAAVPVVPVLAATTGWLPVVGLPVLLVLVVACLAAVPRLARPWWWPASVTVGLGVLPALAVIVGRLATSPSPGTVTGRTGPGHLLGQVVGAGIADRSMIAADLPVAAPAAWWTLAVITWVAARASVALTRSAAVLPVRLGPALLVLGWAGVVAHPQVRLDVTAALVVGTGLLTVLPGRRVLAAGAVVTLCAGGAVAASGTRDGRPADPAALLTGPADPVTGSDPLALAARWASEEPGPAFDIAPVPAAPLRWAVLDRYDGLTWTSGPCPAGHATPGGQQHRITGNALPGPWLPTPAGALASDDGRACVDRGTVLTASPATSFQVWADPHLAVPGPVPTADGVTLTGAEQDTARSLQTDGPDLADEADLADLAAVLRGRSLDPGAVPGQHRSTLLAVARGERPGDRTQYVGAFALLAAGRGHPVRVVVGFTPAGRVRTTDVLVWPEVWFDGQWQAFDPVPTRTVDGSVATPAPAQPVSAPAVAEAADREPSTAEQPGNPDTGQGWLGPAAVTALLGLAGAGLLGVGLLGLRRRRSRADVPAARVARAWDRVLTALGRNAPPPAARPPGEPVRVQWQAMTPRQVAAAVALPGGELGTLAALVTRTAYAERPPSVQDAIDAEQAAATVRRQLRQRRTAR